MHTDKRLRRDPRIGYDVYPELPIGAGQAVRQLAGTFSNPWVWRIVFVGVMALFVYSLWPTPITGAEISYVGLQQEAIAGNIEQITIEGETATGTFHSDGWARSGQISVRGQMMPGEPGDEIVRVNAFTATVPADTQESFIALLEMRGAEVRILE